MVVDFNVEELERVADKLKVMAHPVRLCIMRGLITNGPCNVSNMQECFDMPQPTVSSHLGKLKRAGILKSERAGTEIFYSIEDELMKEIANSIFEEIR